MARVGRTIRGFGEYKINSNSILSGGMSPPMITNSTTHGGVIIRHREYLRDIFATVEFTNTSFDLNPGITTTFPWLSQIAPSFEQYKMRGLVFEFKSTSADTVLSGAASTALGTVIMATQYNALDTPFTNKFEMENWEYSTSVKPSSNCYHPVECAPSQTPVSLLYIRTGEPIGDERLYDLGNFNIAVQGMQNTSGDQLATIGELWCTYEIELYKPKFVQDASTLSAIWTFGKQFGTGGPDPLWNGPTKTYPLGTLTGYPTISIRPPQKAYPQNSIFPSIYVIPNLRRIVFPQMLGKRLLITLNLFYDNDSFVFTAPTPILGDANGLKWVRWFDNMTYGENYSFGKQANGTHACYQACLEVTGNGDAGFEPYFEIGYFSWTGDAGIFWDSATLIVTEVCPEFGGPLFDHAI